MDQTAFHYMCDYGISTHGSIIHIEPTGPEDPIVLIAVTTSGKHFGGVFEISGLIAGRCPNIFTV